MHAYSLPWASDPAAPVTRFKEKPAGSRGIEEFFGHPEPNLLETG